MKKSSIVFRKEFVDSLRDRKALSTILIAPTLNLLLIFVIVNLSVYLQQSSQQFELPVQGIHNAAPIVDWLAEQQVQVVAAPADAAELVKRGELDMVLVFPDDFAQQFAEMEPATVQLIYDRSRKDVIGKAANIKILVQQWSSQIGALRLIVRGVSPQIMAPVQIQDQDVSTDQRGSSMVFGLVALILTITIFTTSTGISIDMMAGERERSTLEALLLSPATRPEILLGKWLTAMAFTLLVLSVVLVAMYLLIPQLPFEKLGVRGELSLLHIVGLWCVAIPLIFLSTILQLFISIFSKSYKEAQSYIGLLMIVPILVGYFVVWSDVSQPWQYWMPLMGTQMLMEDILGNGGSAAINFVGSFGVSLLLALLIAIVTVKQLSRERIIYG